MWFLLWWACASPLPDRYLILQPIDGEYTAAPLEIPSITDARRLEGSLGNAVHGGKLRVDLLEGLEGSESVVDGKPLQIGYTLDGDLGVATDPTGMMLWSFYAHLDGTKADLETRGYDTEPLFPVDIVFEPVISGYPFDYSNAAYSVEAGVFVLLPDAFDGVPYGANIGIVRHEFAHRWFEELTGGARHSYADERALQEGFADAYATLSLDDPTPFEASFNNDDRDVSGDAIADTLAIASSSPYAMGTVYASLAWDLREITDDPSATLDRWVAALNAWHSGTNAEEGAVAEFPNYFLSMYANEPSVLSEACILAAYRFPSEEFAACSPG